MGKSVQVDHSPNPLPKKMDGEDSLFHFTGLHLLIITGKSDMGAWLWDCLAYELCSLGKNILIRGWFIISLITAAVPCSARSWLLTQSLTQSEKALPSWILQFSERNRRQSILSVQLLSHVQLFATPCTAARQGSLSITNSQGLLILMLSQCWHPTISSSVIPFSSCLQSFPLSGSFPVSQLFALGGQNTGVSASASVLPMNTQDWSPLGWTGWVSLQSKGLSRVFSNTTVQKHQFSALSFRYMSNYHVHTWILEKPQLWLDGPLSTK